MNSKRKIVFEPLGKTLRDYRERVYLSQTDVASLFKCKPQFISNWERGMSAPPPSQFRKIENLCGIRRGSIADRYLKLLGEWIEKGAQ
jgi:transcriptional regulator with XRE-family HTH domain